MAVTSNARNKMLEEDDPRVLPVELPATYTTSGDHTGTLSGSNQTNFQNGQITLSSNGILQNAGGGQITNGASIGSLNAGNITTGTLSASRIGAGSITAVKIDSGAVSADKIAAGAVVADKLAVNSVTADKINTNAVQSSKIVAGAITADKIATNAVTADKIEANAVTAGKINVSTLSAITANLGTVNAGTISGSADISISGRGFFDGNYTDGSNNASLHANSSKGAVYGVFARAGLAGVGVIGVSDGSGRTGVTGSSTVSGGFGVKAIGTGGATALDVNGPITISTQTISNLTAGSATNASNATNSSNTASMNGIASSGWCRTIITDSGTANASSTGFVITSTVTGVRTRNTSGRNIVIEEFSDENLKEDIQPEELGLAFISSLTPITYKIDGITYHGIGARETKAQLTRSNKMKTNDSLGRTLTDGTESTSTIGLIAPLIKAVQELNEKIDQLMEVRSNERA